MHALSFLWNRHFIHKTWKVVIFVVVILTQFDSLDHKSTSYLNKQMFVRKNMFVFTVVIRPPSVVFLVCLYRRNSVVYSKQ
jgi:hypothetical protein